MRQLILCTVVAALLAPAPANAETREIHVMKEVVASLDRDTLLVFDVDNTLIEPTGNLGSDQWFYYLVRRLLAAGVAKPEAERRVLALWNDVQWLIRVRPVEKETPAIVAQIQRRGIRTLVLTARAPALALRTRLQLASVGLRFGGLGADLALAADGAVRYTGGILFVGEGRDKGDHLVQLLRRLRLAPKKIVFVDDKDHNVRSVVHALGRARIPCLALRYAAADDRVRAFESDVADARLYLAGELGAESREAIERARRAVAATRP
jgi:phosphoserine phosphatase